MNTENATTGTPVEPIVLCQRRMEERQCRVDGQLGHVERVYQKRGMVAGVFGCKVILDSGRVVYRDVNDVAVF